TQLERMLAVLKWALAEMDQRYRLLESARARDLDTFNRKQERKRQPTLPRIVVLVDELADLMMSAPDQTEHAVVRLAQMARAVGIHLVVAPQRPSTDVVTGLIKANFPSRIAFSVASSIDSRVILDVNGAESLLGRGDMLFLNPEVGTPQRAQGVLLKDQEIDAVIEFWKNQKPALSGEQPPWEGMVQEDGEPGDDLVQQAVDLVTKAQRASASLLQRRLRIGFPRAARLLDQLEEMGIVGPPLGGGKDREVLVEPEEDDPEDSYSEE
ncbi:DNA translocase FtsK, partial [bacterium]|nr:DNA translocase FtsK [bacterium]